MGRTKLIALLTMAGCLTASAVLATRVASSAGRAKLVYQDRVEDGDPPEVALGIAMGAFRGVFVNYLWMRANQLKEEGKYHEAVDLSKMITKLQPRFPRVWAFHAWNLAYNISVATQTPEERWQWVNAGINLLRDQGIPANPGDLLLHRELAWMFIHKLQGTMDDANVHYKRRFAQEWTVALGPPPKRTAEIRDTAQAIEAHVRWLSVTAAAKDSLEEVLAEQPKARELLARLKERADIEPGPRLLETIEVQRSIYRLASEMGFIGSSPEAARPAGDEKIRQWLGRQSGGVNPGVVELLFNPDYQAAWAALVPHLRKRLLIDRYHMEPDRMVRYTRKYGPMDWRHPATHAVYWAARGVEIALDRRSESNKTDFDFVNTDRVVAQSIQELYRSGSIQFDLLNPASYVAMPSADYIPIYGAVIEELISRNAFYDPKGNLIDMNERTYNLYSAGYENFLKDAVAFLYRRGQKGEAEKYQKQLYTWAGRNQNDRDAIYDDTKPLSEFVIDQIKDRLTTPNVAVAEVFGSLDSAFINGLLGGDRQLFLDNLAYAKLFHEQYRKQMIFDTAANRELNAARGEIFDRDFSVVAAKALARAISLVGITDGAVIYRRAPEDLKMVALEILEAQLKPQLAPAAAQGAPDFESWFPPPEGYEAFKAARAAQRAADAPAAAPKELK
ncbi:MAG: hypothetical protein JNM07_09370 [Phycisphaerae bacterium]|nr:hypothetical protein [Phycisphaerae bacterium]